jgi:hypothetical protein
MRGIALYIFSMCARERSENKHEAVPNHRFMLVFRIHPLSQREGRMGEIALLNMLHPGKKNSG